MKVAAWSLLVVGCLALVIWLVPHVPAYTLSLSIWAVPVAAMTFFLHRRHLMSDVVRRALWISLAVIAVLGSALDLAFARFFFTFPNPAAVLGIRIEGIPIEEFAFYLLGGWFLALAYVFCDEYWLSRYNRPDGVYREWARRLPRLFLPSRRGWLLLLFAAAGGILFKAWRNPVGMPVPGYYLFLLCVAYGPFFLFDRMVKNFVNWRAFAMTLSVTLGVSLLWEVTLAIPGGWWGYQDGAMLGVFIAPWYGLPVEAVTVWIFSSFAVLIYEAAKIFLHRRDQRSA
jgi:lycopene cyclase domain-containing protein